MKQTQVGIGLIALALAMTLIGVSHANTSNTTVVARGLDGPRGRKFGPDGNLYVAESGTRRYQHHCRTVRASTWRRALCRREDRQY